MNEYYGAEHDLNQLIKTHVFVISPNNSGSTFLQKALATSNNTWNLAKEGHHTYGFIGPTPFNLNRSLLWAADEEGINLFTDASAYNWKKTRKAWYFQAFSKDKLATVFVEKSPPSLLRVKQLQQEFCNANFLFMVRNPYAVVEGITRWRERIVSIDVAQAAEHVIQCFYYQKKNIDQHSDNGVFFHYEEMCAQPEKVKLKIETLVPELHDLQLNQKLSVKGLYDQKLQDMNAQQIEKLSPEILSKINHVFIDHSEILEHFGYTILRK